MLKVKVSYDKADEKGSIKLTGYMEEYPEVGKTLAIQVFKDFSKVIVDFGRVYNIESHGDLLLVQTDWIVAEVQILDDGASGDNSSVVSLRRLPKNTRTARQVKALLDEIRELRA